MNTDPRLEAAIAAVDEDIESYGAVTRDGYPLHGPTSDMPKEAFLAGLAAFQKASIVTTTEELDALPVGSVVKSEGYRYSLTYPNYPFAFQKLYDGLWHRGGRSSDTHPDLIVPAVVISYGN